VRRRSRPLLDRPRPNARRPAIPTPRKKSRAASARRSPPKARTAPKAKPKARRTGASPPPAKRPPPPRPRAEQPLGAGVADAFALKRLQIPPQGARPAKEVREVGWAEFGALAKDLADRIGEEYRPDVVVGVVNGGVFIGGALASSLRAEFHPVRVPKNARNRPVAEPLADLHGKAVLVVDDVIMSGKTLAAAAAAARKAGARETRTAALVARPDRAHPDFHALESSELIVFGWDYQLDQGGTAGTDDPGEQGV
jgi:hypoxanthine phosphoribosyltransferase